MGKIETIEAIRLEDDAEVVINAADFDEKLYAKTKKKGAKKTKKEAPAKEKADDGFSVSHRGSGRYAIVDEDGAPASDETYGSEDAALAALEELRADG